MKNEPSTNPGSSLTQRLTKYPIQCPGLTPGAREIERLTMDLPKRLDAFFYKEHSDHLWIVFLGGTGTGKSTLFNALCGEDLSSTGVERPKTWGPVAYLYHGMPLEQAFPFHHIHIERYSGTDSSFKPVSGKSGQLLVLNHRKKPWAHLVLVDTPDVDSVEEENREITEDLYLLADAIVFVSSQEKYADDVPYRFLLRVLDDGKPCYFLLNKAQEEVLLTDVLAPLTHQGVTLDQERMWLIPYLPRAPRQRISEAAPFKAFRDRLLNDLSPNGLAALRDEIRSRRNEDLRARISGLLETLEQEEKAAEEWSRNLEAIFKANSEEFLREERERFAQRSREFLGREIRKLFQRYDVFATPRRILKTFLMLPFKLLGFRGSDSRENRMKELRKVRAKMDLEPILRTMAKFNALILENLSPSNDEVPLFQKMRLPGTILSEKDIKNHIRHEQERLDKWLEETFQKMSREIPQGKKWGIYSTSILWGILILSFETVVGGGFTVLDAALDSALAPFVTKGAVELFAYHEIQRIARELAARYQEGILSVLRLQKKRYEECLNVLMTSPETRQTLKTLYAGLPEV